MKMKKYIAILLILATLLCSGCTKKATHEGYLLFTSSPIGARIEYPEKWTKQVAEDKKSVAFVTPKEGNGDFYRENLSIMYESLGENTFEEFYAKHRNQLVQSIAGYSETENSEVFLDNKKAYRLVYSGHAEEDGKETANLRFLQYLVESGDRVYFVTYIGYPDSYDYFYPSIKIMLETLQFS